MKNSEIAGIAIAAIKEGVIKPTLTSVYTFLDAWSYLFFGQHPEHLNKRGIYEFIRPSYAKDTTESIQKLRRKNNVDEER